jgi:hypothetical protein
VTFTSDPPAGTAFSSRLNRRNPIVKNPRSLVGLAAALTCILTLATGSARAQLGVGTGDGLSPPGSLQYGMVPSMTLTPYHLVFTGEGTCLSGGHLGIGSWPFAFAEPCDDASIDQVFYLLKSDSDDDFLWQNIPPGTRPSARIVWTRDFDRSRGSYMYLGIGDTLEQGFKAVDVAARDQPVQASNTWYVVSVPAPAITWTHVANQGESFSIGGRRTFRYGTDPTYVTKTLEGDNGNGGVGQCNQAFFGLPGTGRTCDLQTPVDPATPYQVQFESVQDPGYCLTRGLARNMVATACNSGLPNYPTTWTFVPVPYLTKD